MRDDLSILTPVYNERPTIEAAIDDALAAALPIERRELIVVDDGSGDGTRQLLRARPWPEEVKASSTTATAAKGLPSVQR